MRAAVLVSAAVLALGACGGDEESARVAGTSEPSSELPAAGCPIDDPELCARAAPAAAAVREGDAARLVELSYADTFVCDDLPPELFPGCSPGETLEGHAVTSADGKIEVLPAEEYEARLAELVAFDEVTVTGVGTCGPDDPDRRSYHLAFWAVNRDGGGSGVERRGGSLEFVRREGEWSIGLLYADSIAGWRTVYADPEAELACGNVQPWGPPRPGSAGRRSPRRGRTARRASRSAPARRTSRSRSARRR